MNILILSCGTRYKLVEYFKACYLIDKVVVTDCSTQAPALYIADKYYIVPRMLEEGYMEALLEICVKEEINFVLPLQEEELLLTAKNRVYFESIGAVPIVSDYEKVLLCKDKYALNTYLNDNGISAVHTILAKDYLDSNSDIPKLFVKPRMGAGSIDTFSVTSRRLLEALVEETEDELIVQPCILGKEYGVDVYVDLLSNEVITCFCKEKLRMRAGETEKSLSVRNTDIEKLVKDAVLLLGLKGPLDVDVMEENGIYYILEINPRFGGGYPHAYMCGISFPEYIANNGANIPNTVSDNFYMENVLAMKYSEILIDKSKT